MSSTKKKVLTTVLFLFIILTLIISTNIIVNFKTFSESVALNQANSIALSIRDSLTSDMVNNTMDKRELFLNNMIKHQKVQNLHLFRSKKVIELFGNGTSNENMYSNLEAKVAKEGKRSYEIHENLDKAIISIAIPYIAKKNETPNCLQCHTNAKDGDVLGVISMDVDITPVRSEGVVITVKIIAITIVFLIIAMFIGRRFVKPYIKLFNDLEEGISKAYSGDFSSYVQTQLSDEAGKVAEKLNELSEIFRFKKTIELDDKKEIIYERLAHILEDRFKIEHFLILEINDKTLTRKIIYNRVDENRLPASAFATVANDCRAYRTSSNVLSSEFYKICMTCYNEGCEYFCMPFKISDSISIVLHIREHSVEEIEKIRSYEPIIRNYFELAQPVLESKYLTDILKEKSLRDSLTGLYNRGYLENVTREIEDKSCIFFMLDIDLFKSVNDTYGHDVGDEVIVALTDLLKKSIKGSDIALRLGGEEFLLILFNITSKDAIKIANNIRENFSQLIFDVNGNHFSKTISIGIAQHHTLKKVKSSIKEADIALYYAKEHGRNQAVLYDESMNEEVEDNE